MKAITKGTRVRWARNGVDTRNNRPIHWTNETGTVVAVWTDFVPGVGRGEVCEVVWDNGCTHKRTTNLPLSCVAAL